MNNNGRNSNNEEAEEIEIINVSREGMSYGELKRIHNLSMVSLSNMSKILPSTSTSTSSTSTTLYSSTNVRISKTNNNWLVPYYPFKESCRACNYFGHSFKICPNLKQEFQGANACLNCWRLGHVSNECREETKGPPYNDNFRSPEEIIIDLIYK